MGHLVLKFQNHVLLVGWRKIFQLLCFLFPVSRAEDFPLLVKAICIHLFTFIMIPDINILLCPDEMYVFSSSQKRVSVELVGKNKVEEKLKNLNDLTSASVSYMGVSSIGPGDELKNLVPSTYYPLILKSSLLFDCFATQRYMSSFLILYIGNVTFLRGNTMYIFCLVHWRLCS
jgi:hypothetical protein